jgi:hypothetical protein
METAFKQANYAGGVVSGIQAVTQHLVEHFPAVGDDRNELPDQPVALWLNQRLSASEYGPGLLRPKPAALGLVVSRDSASKRTDTLRAR